MRYRLDAFRVLRRQMGLSLEDVARKAAPISVRQLRHIERGHSIPRADTLGRLAAALGVPISDFFKRVA